MAELRYRLDADRALCVALIIALMLLAISAVSAMAHSSRLSSHMLQHALMMNVVAPLAVVGLQGRRPAKSYSSFQLGAVTVSQLLLLWVWHMPPVLAGVHANPLLSIFMHASLFAVALMFWRMVIGLSKTRPLAAVSALLITGKLYCLYGVLLIFASRGLFDQAGHQHLDSQADQQLAGLIMVSACPLTYIAAAVVIVTRWINALEPNRAETP